MKILIISDIHGDYDSFNKALENEKYDKLIVLGDLFEYGSYYDEIDDSEIINKLIENKNKLLLIKGNCDYMIDYEKYGLYAHDIFSLTINNHVFTFTHGHLYNKINLPRFYGDVFVTGHTHIPKIEKEKNIIYLNPGSIGKPRGLSSKSYILLDENKIQLKTIDRKIIKEMILN